MNDQDDPKSRRPTVPPDSQQPISAASLFRGKQQVLIEHDGEIYRLLLTRNNKLLLQK